MPGGLVRALYLIATWVAFAVLWPVLWLHPKTRRGTAQRLGFLETARLPREGRPRVWLHGASAGDLLALAPLAAELRRRYPSAALVASTMTNTGWMMATDRLRSVFDAVVYAPWDLHGATRRAVRAVAPDLLVLEYAELWPNLIAAAKASGAAVVLSNGRFAPRRERWYRLLFRLVGNPLETFDALFMRDEGEAERAIRMGAPPHRVHVTGNTKFDALVPAAAGSAGEHELERALNLEPGAPVWFAGSTHEGEEDGLIAVYQSLAASYPGLSLVIAPRYVERAPKVLGLVAAAGLKGALRSAGNPGRARVIVLDSIGELSRAYRLATLTFVGGSFTARGGQNILEPAAQGKPVLFGPHMENFQDAATVLVGRGGLQVPDLQHLEAVMRELLDRPSTIASLGAMAERAVRSVTGASARNAELISEVLRRRGFEGER